MKLLSKYEKHDEIYKSGYVFDPENCVFYTDNPDEFRKPPGYESWDVAKWDRFEYLNTRLAELGATDDDNYIELLGGPRKNNTEITPEPVFIANQRGDIEILQYELNRQVLVAKDGNKERYVFQVRLNPWHELLTGAKYDFVKGKTVPFWHKSLVETYEAKTETDTLFITEGQIKAFKAGKEGLPVVGFTSITHYKDAANGKMHGEVIDFIRECKVKRVVVLWDGDCRNISEEQLKNGVDLTKRPHGFFSTVRRIRTLIQDFFPKIDLYFATIKTYEFDAKPKGLDDLLISYAKDIASIKDDFTYVGQRPGKYIEWINITKDAGLTRLREFFQLHSPQAFYQFHKEGIQDKQFVFYGTTYKINKEGHLAVQISKELKCYKRIGPEYYKLKWTPVSKGMNGETVLEEQLVPWNKQAIVDDHSKEDIKHIERYEGFVNIASHTDYRPIIDNHYNLYYNIKHNLMEGEFPMIEKLIRHIFQDQYEMGLDYITLLYRQPKQKLPILCLLSREQATGKSTFIYMLKLIFKQNMAIVSNSDLTSDFNSHWTSKLIVACEETLLEKKEAGEKLKSLSTAHTITRNEKNKAATEIECMLHFILASNHEEDFMRLYVEDERYWILKVPPRTETIPGFDQMIEEEIPYFVNFIASREITYQTKGYRMFFEPADIRTEAFFKIVETSEPTVIKEIREELTESFMKWGGQERHLTTGDLKTHFGIKGDKTYIDRVITQYLKAERYKTKDGKPGATNYTFPIDDPSNHEAPVYLKRSGRFFIFKREMFLSSDIAETKAAMPAGVDTAQTKMALEPGTDWNASFIELEKTKDEKTKKLMQQCQYIMRAECIADVEAIDKEAIPYFITLPLIDGFPDVVVLFNSPLKLEQLKWAIEEVEDSHVMLETISLRHSYTGERLPF